MGLTGNKRFAPSIHCNSGTGSSSGGNAFPEGARDVNLSGSTDPCSEGGYLLAKRPSGGFCLPTISGPQKGWWVSSSSELEGPEQVHPRGALQDGGVPHGERSGEAGGLVSKDRFEGCLFPNPGASLSPEVSPVYLEGKSVPVPVSSIRTLMCPPGVYESNEASSGLSQRKGNQIDNLFGRPTDYLQQSRDPVGPNQLNPRFVPDSRSGHQRDKISDDIYPGDCVLGFSSFISKNDHLSPSGKNEENQAGCSSSAAEAPCVDTGNGHLCGKDHSSQSSNQGSSSIPSSTSSTDKQCNFTSTVDSRSATGLPSECSLDHRDKGRVTMVGSRSFSPQSNGSGNSAARHGNRDRCLSNRLGCPTSGVPDRGAMVNRRETDAYQCVGAAGSISCPQDFCQRQITFECASSNVQYVSQSLHKPFGGHTLPSVELTGSSDVEMVPGSPHFPNSRTPARQGESDSRRGIQGSERSLRLDDTSKSFFPDTVSDGSVDLFASRLTHQLPRFFSWRPDPLAEATDAFTQDWSQFQGYANPPWCLILRTLSKIQREEARVLLIAPVWRTQPWYPLLLQLLIKIPRLLPEGKEMVISPTQKDFIMPTGVPQLAAWPLSGKSADQEAFQRELLIYSQHPGGARPPQVMKASSNAGIAGVRNGIEIPLGVL